MVLQEFKAGVVGEPTNTQSFYGTTANHVFRSKDWARTRIQMTKRGNHLSSSNLEQCPVTSRELSRIVARRLNARKRAPMGTISLEKKSWKSQCPLAAIIPRDQSVPWLQHQAAETAFQIPKLCRHSLIFITSEWIGHQPQLRGIWLQPSTTQALHGTFLLFL